VLILIVEDNLITRTLLQNYLEKWGYGVVSVNNINSAIEVIEAQKIQLVITDWLMPGGNGIQLCQHIRALRQPFYTYVIIITSLEESQFAAEGLQSGADDFIRKPLQYDELRARIKAGERILELERNLQEKHGQLLETSDKLRVASELINKDLGLAMIMQRSLLPSITHQYKGVSIDWLFEPSTQLSGDIFNCFAMGEQHIGFYILDVVGHGIASAMQSFTLSQLLAMKSNNIYPPPCTPTQLPPCIAPSARTIVTNLNRNFQTDAINILYFTMIYGVIDTLNGSVDLCQAGHPYALYLKSGGTAEYIAKSNLPVGIVPNMDFESVTLRYASGDRIIIYSDGITECQNKAGEMFGSKRLQAFFNASAHLKLVDLIKMLKEYLHEWRGGEDFDDDVSLLILEFN